MSNGFVVNEKDWEKMNPTQQSWMTFNAVQAMDERVKKLESRNWIFSIYSFIGGVVGGIAFNIVKILKG